MTDINAYLEEIINRAVVATLFQNPEVHAGSFLVTGCEHIEKALAIATEFLTNMGIHPIWTAVEPEERGWRFEFTVGPKVETT